MNAEIDSNKKEIVRDAKYWKDLGVEVPVREKKADIGEQNPAENNAEVLPLEQEPEQIKDKTIQEKNNKIIQDFDLEIKAKEEQEKNIEEQISKIEKNLQTNKALNVPESFNVKLRKDSEEVYLKRDELLADLEKTKPSETEQMISDQIGKINKNIENIRRAESQDLPETIPSSILEGRKKDIEELEKQKVKMLEEADIAKVEKINKYKSESRLVEKKAEEPEKETEEVEEIKETAEQKREREVKALEVLSDPNFLEHHKPKEIAESFESIVGDKENGNLAERRNKMVLGNFEKRGVKVYIGVKAVEKYRQEIIQKEEKRIANEEHSKALTTLWQRNPGIKEADKEKYLTKIKKNLGLEGDKWTIALDKLINDGYSVEKGKKGWFSSQVKIPKIGGKGALIYDSKTDLFDDMTKEAASRINGEAEIRADLKIIAGHKKFLAERKACTEEIVEQTVAEYNSRNNPEKGEKQIGNKEIAEEQLEGESKKIDYIPLDAMIKKVHALNGRTRDVIPEELIEVINNGQEKIGAFSNKLSVEEWNKTMEAHSKANQLMAEWIEKKSGAPVQEAGTRERKEKIEVENGENEKKYKKTIGFFERYVKRLSKDIKSAEKEGDAKFVKGFKNLIDEGETALSSLKEGNIYPAALELLEMVRRKTEEIEGGKIPKRETKEAFGKIDEFLKYLSELNSAK